MVNISQYEQDLASIRTIMERSSRFISLSGISGILAGIYALIGSTIAYYLVYYPHNPFGYRFHYINESKIIVQLLVTAILVLVLSLITGYLFSVKKAKKQRSKIWDKTSKRLLWAGAIPLITGAIFIIILISRGYFMIVAPACLIFYGLALLNASNFTFEDVKYLGYAEIILGLIAAIITGYGLVFWALGFGVLHIVYGSIMHFKYDREK